MERCDVRCVEIFEIFALELNVLQWSEGGELGKTEKRDDGMDERVRCRRGMRITVDVDGEPVR
jgi:hypothetical protein